MMRRLRLILAALVWIPALILVEFPAWLGAQVIVRLLAFRWERWVKDVPSRADPSKVVRTWRPRWLRIWGNDEDGVDGPYLITPRTAPSLRRWIERMQGKSLRVRIVSWSANRNPAANLRFSRWGVYLEPERMEWIGNSRHPWQDYKADLGIEGFTPLRTYWCWGRQGWRSGLWIIRTRRSDPRRYFLIRVGWRIFPSPLREIDRWTGFALQAGPRRADFREEER